MTQQQNNVVGHAASIDCGTDLVTEYCRDPLCDGLYFAGEHRFIAGFAFLILTRLFCASDS